MSTERIAVTIGYTFFDDHENRGLVTKSGDATEYILSRNTKRNTITVSLSRLDMEELLDDAEHYSTEWVYMGREFLGLGSSARATAKKVRALLNSTGVK